MDAGVGPQHGQSHEGMFGAERDRSVEVVSGMFNKLCRHPYRGKSSYRLLAAQSSGQLNVRDVVEIELLNFTDKVWNGGRHADLLLQMVEAPQMNRAPLKTVVLALQLGPNGGLSVQLQFQVGTPSRETDRVPFVVVDILAC